MDRPIDKSVKIYRKASPRHVFVAEAAISHEGKCFVFGDAEKVRKIGNELKTFMMKRMDQLFRTKRYRKLCSLYKKYAEAGDQANRKHIGGEMNQMQKEHGVTFDDCRAESVRLKHKYDLHSHIVRAAFDNVWKGVLNILYEGGRKLHFRKRGELPFLQAAERTKAVLIKNIAGRLVLRYGEHSFSLIVKKGDIFAHEEIDAMLSYLEDPERSDLEAAWIYETEGRIVDTFRPCYAMLEPKMIRNRMRVYVHIVVEGKAKAKKCRDGSPRYSYGVGNVGIDIGTQTAAWTSNDSVGLINLAERGELIEETEKKIADLRTAMNRSLRDTNPECFRPDGEIIKGSRMKNFSKRYRRLKARLRDVHRKSALNRHLAINEFVNDLRALGNIVITERQNTQGLMKRSSSPAEKSAESGKWKKKKRFGKSVLRRCPGYLHLQLRNRFEHTGGIYTEVPDRYRASQYDVTCNDYLKKSLGARHFPLSDGTMVQRDMYSSYLLFCADEKFKEIDIGKCRTGFASWCARQEECIADIRRNKMKIKNSGIRVS